MTLSAIETIFASQVRVCDSCYDQFGPKDSSSGGSDNPNSPVKMNKGPGKESELLCWPMA